MVSNPSKTSTRLASLRKAGIQPQARSDPPTALRSLHSVVLPPSRPEVLFHHALARELLTPFSLGHEPHPFPIRRPRRMSVPPRKAIVELRRLSIRSRVVGVVDRRIKLRGARRPCCSEDQISWIGGMADAREGRIDWVGRKRGWRREGVDRIRVCEGSDEGRGGRGRERSEEGAKRRVEGKVRGKEAGAATDPCYSRCRP